MKKMKLPRMLCLFWLALVFINLKAQYQLPIIIPPDPVSSQFQKYLGYPVSMATGLANISIPLYTLHAAGMTIPFSLNYRSEGVKVDEYPGDIGYGWSLFPGCRITRTIMGNPDDLCKTDNIQNMASGSATLTEYLRDIAVSSAASATSPPRHDGQYDIFTAHLPNQSITFIMKWVNGALTGIPIPDAPVKIVPITRSSVPLYFSDFKIIDDKGISYIFGQNYRDYSDAGTCTWMLEQIIAPGNNNVINFTYQNSTNTSIYHTIQTIAVDDGKSGCSSGGIGGVSADDVFKATFGDPPLESTWPGITYNTWALTSITFPTGRVSFSYADQNYNRITAIDVYNQVVGGTNVKSISFTRTLNSDPLPNLLRTVSLSGEGKYTFDYNMQPFTYREGQDFSGFYNGQHNSNFSLVPSVLLDISGNYSSTSTSTVSRSFGYANREPNEEMMKSHILTKVTYPTGGSSTFTYEANRFMSKGVESFGLGLRVAAIDTYDPVSGKTITKTYKYGENESGLGKLGITNYVDANNNISTLDANAFVTERTLSGYYLDLYFLSLRRITISSNNRFSNFSFNVPVWYSQVAEYSDGGKTIYQYDYNPSYFVGYSTKDFLLRFFRNLGLSGPRLTLKQVFNSNGTLLEKTTYNYSTDLSYIKGLMVEPQSLYYENGSVLDYGTILTASPGTNLSNLANNPTFLVQPYDIEIGSDNLMSSATRNYFNSDSIETTTTNTYDNNYQYNLSSKTTTTSDNGTVTEKYYYPVGAQAPDLATLTTDQQTMVTSLANQNYLTTSVQKETYKNSTLLNSELFGYKDWSNFIYAPEQVYVKTGSNPYESRLHYYNYDSKGNVLSVSKENNIKVSYIWGYNQTLPTAKAVNATITDIAYSGFESTYDLGNWTTNFSPPYVTGGAAIGNGYLDWPTGSISKSGLSASKKYKVSFYAKSSGSTAISISGYGTLSFYGNNQWKRYEVEATGVATVSLTLTSGLASIDEIKLCPSNAQMTTYTYDPLVGMTSSTDENNQTTYYTYDTFGRLQTIKDNKGNILKSYDYHYKQ